MGWAPINRRVHLAGVTLLCALLVRYGTPAIVKQATQLLDHADAGKEGPREGDDLFDYLYQQAGGAPSTFHEEMALKGTAILSIKARAPRRSGVSNPSVKRP